MWRVATFLGWSFIWRRQNGWKFGVMADRWGLLVCLGRRSVSIDRIPF